MYDAIKNPANLPNRLTRNNSIQLMTMQPTCTIETVCAMNADHIQRIVCYELIDQFYETLCLVMGRSFTVATALQFCVLATVFFNFTSVIEPFGVCQIDPQTNFSLQQNMKVECRFSSLTLQAHAHFTLNILA